MSSYAVSPTMEWSPSATMNPTRRVGLDRPGTEAEPGDSTLPTLADTWFQAVESLRNLGRGWNSYDALPVSEVSIHRATDFVLDWGGTLPAPTVVPTAPGGVEFVWGGDHDGVELEFLPDGSVGLLIDVNGEIREMDLQSLDDPRVAEIWPLVASLG